MGLSITSMRRWEHQEIDSHTFKLSFQAVMNGSCERRQRRRTNYLKQIRFFFNILKKILNIGICYSSFHVCPSEPHKLKHTSKNHRNDDKPIGFRIYIRLKKSYEILMESTSLG